MEFVFGRITRKKYRIKEPTEQSDIPAESRTLLCVCGSCPISIQKPVLHKTKLHIHTQYTHTPILLLLPSYSDYTPRPATTRHLYYITLFLRRLENVENNIILERVIIIPHGIKIIYNIVIIFYAINYCLFNYCYYHTASAGEAATAARQQQKTVKLLSSTGTMPPATGFDPPAPTVTVIWRRSLFPFSLPRSLRHTRSYPQFSRLHE